MDNSGILSSLEEVLGHIDVVEGGDKGGALSLVGVGEVDLEGLPGVIRSSSFILSLTVRV